MNYFNFKLEVKRHYLSWRLLKNYSTFSKYQIIVGLPGINFLTTPILGANQSSCLLSYMDSDKERSLFKQGK